MGRAVVILVGAILSLGTILRGPSVAVQDLPFKLSGDPDVVVDTNDNGMPDESDGRCNAFIALTYSGPVGDEVTAECQQGTGEHDIMLRALGWFDNMATYIGEVESFEDGAGATAAGLGATNVFGSVQQTFGSVNSEDNNIFGRASKREVGTGRFKTELEIEQQGEPSSGEICDFGGPAAQVLAVGGACIIKRIELPTEERPEHVRVRDVPFEDLYGSFVLLDIFIPVSGGPQERNKFVLTVGENGGTLITELPLDELAPCGGCGGVPAPMMPIWGLAGLTLGLLLLGTWVLGRRRAFYESLPLP